MLIGAEKAGTTWLYDVLRAHPDVFLPDTKEVHYFNQLDSNLVEIDNFSHRDKAWYEAHFDLAQPSQLIGEATPLYLCDPAAPERIHANLPDAKLVVVLRDPVARAWSHYRMASAKNHVSDDFDTLIARHDPRILNRGLYGAQLERWISLFPRAQIKVLSFEAMMAAPGPALTDLAQWLGLAPEPLLSLDLNKASNAATNYRSAWFYNASVRASRALRNFGPTKGLVRGLKASGLYDLVKAANKTEAPKATLSPSQRAKLVEFYRSDVERLGALLGDEAPSWPSFD